MSPRCCAARYSGACPHYLPLTVSPPRVSWADCAPRVTALVCAPRRVRGGGAGQGRARSHEWAHFYCSQPSPAQPDSVLYTRNCSRFTLWALGGGCFDTEARDNEAAVSTNYAPTLFILIILPFLLSGAGSGPIPGSEVSQWRWYACCLPARGCHSFKSSHGGITPLNITYGQSFAKLPVTQMVPMDIPEGP